MRNKKIKFSIYLSILCLVVLFFSSCSLFEKEPEDNWQDEVLMASECGEDGLMCCIEKDPPCKYGDCCYDPNNEGVTMCSETCELGTLDSFCREGNDCDEGLACKDGVCQECGDLDDPCCSDKTCNSDLACFRGTCVECGITGNPCCASEEKCDDSDPTLLERAECIQEICTLCGANGNRSCGNEPSCNEGHLLNRGTCYRCGGFNQPCCTERIGKETTKFCIEDGLECKLDFCSN